MQRKRAFAGRLEWLLAAAAAVGLLAFLLFSGGGKEERAAALVFIGGECVMEIDLSAARDARIDLSEHGLPAALEIRDGRIRFVDVTCPDHICEKTGFIHMDGQSAVCMPNRVAVTIVAYP